MKTDKVTKVLLSVIAVNLSILTISNLDLIPKAHANDSITNSTPSINYGLVPLNEDGSITVKVISSEELDVNITGISTFDEMDVNIEEIGGGHVSHGGPIPVEVE